MLIAVHCLGGRKLVSCGRWPPLRRGRAQGGAADWKPCLEAEGSEASLAGDTSATRESAALVSPARIPTA
eukprot:scaffold802_cov280-Pinguiococcus_pyrenoidosus.AAC.7